MLVLSRRSNEAVVVGPAAGFDHILKVTVVDIGHGRVRLGFEVDTNVPVHRAEVWERIHVQGPPASANGGSASPTNQETS